MVEEGFEAAAPIHVGANGRSVFGIGVPGIRRRSSSRQSAGVQLLPYLNVDLYLRDEWRGTRMAQGIRSCSHCERTRLVWPSAMDACSKTAPTLRSGVRTSLAWSQLEIMLPAVAAARFGIEIRRRRPRALSRHLIEVASLPGLTACLDRGGVELPRPTIRSISILPSVLESDCVRATIGRR